MKRRFLVPALVALALHLGLFFGVPRGESRPVVPDPDAVVPLENMPLALREEPPPASDSGKVDSAPASPPVPALLEPLVSDQDAPFKISVDVTPPNLSLIQSRLIPAKIGMGTIPGGIGTGTGVVDARLLDAAPVAILQMRPAYPPSARSQGVAGEVTVEFLVDEGGVVRNPRVVASSDRVFDAAALRAVEQWRFEPGMKDHQKVPFRMTVPLRFRIDR